MTLEVLMLEDVEGNRFFYNGNFERIPDFQLPSTASLVDLTVGQGDMPLSGLDFFGPRPDLEKRIRFTHQGNEFTLQRDTDFDAPTEFEEEPTQEFHDYYSFTISGPQVHHPFLIRKDHYDYFNDDYEGQKVEGAFYLSNEVVGLMTDKNGIFVAFGDRFESSADFSGITAKSMSLLHEGKRDKYIIVFNSSLPNYHNILVFNLKTKKIVIDFDPVSGLSMEDAHQFNLNDGVRAFTLSNGTYIAVIRPDRVDFYRPFDQGTDQELFVLYRTIDCKSFRYPIPNPPGGVTFKDLKVKDIRQVSM